MGTTQLMLTNCPCRRSPKAPGRPPRPHAPQRTAMRRSSTSMESAGRFGARLILASSFARSASRLVCGGQDVADRSEVRR